MRFQDLRNLDGNAEIEADLCLVGSGPVGLSIANEFAGTGLSVVVLEAGGMDDDPNIREHFDFENVGAPRLPSELSRRRVFGGCSTAWTGRCAPFDEYDFEQRPWVEHSGWPLTRPELDPYMERAGVYLGLGPHCYDENLWDLLKVARPKVPLDDRYLEPTFWQFSKSPFGNRSVNFGRDFAFDNTPNIRTLLNATLTHINTNPEGTRFESAEISTPENRRTTVRAKALVLGCNGIENARLLLASNRLMPRGVGNQHDTVGRYLMDHPLCILGGFDPKDAKRLQSRLGFFRLQDAQGTHLYHCGVTLSKKIQREEQLLRCDALLQEFDVSDDDPWLALKRLKSDLRSRRPSRRTLQDGKLILSRPGEIAVGLYQRFVNNRPHVSKARRLELLCMLEQKPDPESRITLSAGKKDAFGVPIPVINWKLGECERRSAARITQLVVQELQRLSLPVPIPSPWLERLEDWIPHCEEKAHPTGTTRISLDPKQGVVDPNLQVHGIHGLFIAGSSVFPTSGTANPMLMIVTMALRLSDHLKTAHFQLGRPAPSLQAVRSSENGR